MVRIGDELLGCKCRVQQTNPKHGMSAQRYDKYKRAMTLGEVIELGGSRADICFDVKRGYIMLEDQAVHAYIAEQGAPPPLVSPSTTKNKGEKRPRDDPKAAEARAAARRRVRLLEVTRHRAKNLGRTVGRGRLIPAVAPTLSDNTARNNGSS